MLPAARSLRAAAQALPQVQELVRLLGGGVSPPAAGGWPLRVAGAAHASGCGCSCCQHASRMPLLAAGLSVGPVRTASTSSQPGAATVASPSQRFPLSSLPSTTYDQEHASTFSQSAYSRQQWHARRNQAPAQLMSQLAAWSQALAAPGAHNSSRPLSQPLSAARRLNHEPEPFEGEVESDNEFEMDEFEELVGDDGDSDGDDEDEDEDVEFEEFEDVEFDEDKDDADDAGHQGEGKKQ